MGSCSEEDPSVRVLLDSWVVNSPPGRYILDSLSSREDEGPSSLGGKRKRFSYKVHDLEIPCSLTWILKQKSTWVPYLGSMIFIKGSDLGKLMERGVFSDWIESLNSEMHITLIIYQFDSYFGSSARIAQRKKAAAVRGEIASTSSTDTSSITALQAHKALCNVRLSRGKFDYLNFNTNYERIGDVVYHYTRAASEAQEKEKKQLPDEFGFYAPSVKGNVSVNSSGVGCLNLWQSYLSQISSFVGVDRAKAITSLYPCPLSLINALCSSPNPEELLTDVRVRRGADLMEGGSLRIGAELSRKVAKMFLSLNGNDFLKK